MVHKQDSESASH
jgi:hypothetical protein